MGRSMRVYIDESYHLEHDGFPVMCVGGTYVREIKKNLFASKEGYHITNNEFYAQ